ncbi:MAG: hypothetical protein JW798_00475 [Prolixibacteraceae bacterium]|nr:hypothetical protein [Prolixibacteraceae bacterium]
MKTKLFLISFVFCIVFSGLLSIAQAPEKVSYQSVIRDTSGDLVRSQTVGMQISILQGSAEGTAVYVEIHTPETNVNGLATIEIGNGTPVSGTFSTIDWSDGPYFLKVETDPDGGTSYSITGTSEIISVPYALHAKSVKGAVDADNSVVSNVADPVQDQDAATKVYVDNLLSTIQAVQIGFVDPRDGNHYNTLLIGTQLWMAENLAWLPSVSPPEDGSEDGDGTESYYYVNGYEGTDISDAKATGIYQTYGVLYNWSAALTACPTGWHLPTDNEWTILTDYLTDNGYGYEGSGTDIAKSVASTLNWVYHSMEGTPGNDPISNNSSGFSGLPGGYRSSDGNFISVGDHGYWWSSSEYDTNDAWLRSLDFGNTDIYLASYNKEVGFSIRCVRDN